MMTDTTMQTKNRVTGDKIVPLNDRVSSEEGSSGAEQMARILTERSAGLLGLCHILKQKKIGYKQFFLLELLIESGETTMTSIAGTLSMKTAAVTGMIDRLSKPELGYVQRYDCSEDRRKRLVRITAKGEKAVTEIRELMQELFAGLLVAEAEGRSEEVEPVYENLRDLVDA